MRGWFFVGCCRWMGVAIAWLWAKLWKKKSTGWCCLFWGVVGVGSAHAQERAWECVLPLQEKSNLVVYSLVRPERLVLEMPVAAVTTGELWPKVWPRWMLGFRRLAYRAGRQRMVRWIFQFRSVVRYQIRTSRQSGWILRIDPPAMRTLPWLALYQRQRGDTLFSEGAHGISHSTLKSPMLRDKLPTPTHLPPQHNTALLAQQSEKERMQREKERMQREKERMQREKERAYLVHRTLTRSHYADASMFLIAAGSLSKTERMSEFEQAKRVIALFVVRMERLSARLARYQAVSDGRAEAWQEESALHPKRIVTQRLQRWLRKAALQKYQRLAAFLRMQQRLWKKEISVMFLPVIVGESSPWLEQRHLEPPDFWDAWLRLSKKPEVLLLNEAIWIPNWTPPVPKPRTSAPKVSSGVMRSRSPSKAALQGPAQTPYHTNSASLSESRGTTSLGPIIRGLRRAFWRRWLREIEARGPWFVGGDKATVSPQGDVWLVMPRWLKKHTEQQHGDLWRTSQHSETSDVVGRTFERSRFFDRAVWLEARTRWDAMIRFEEKRRSERFVGKVSLSTHHKPNPRSSDEIKVEQAVRERHQAKKRQYPPYQKTSMVRASQKTSMVRVSQKTSMVRASQKTSMVRASQKTSMIRGVPAVKRRMRWKRSPTLIDVLERLVPLERAAPKNRL
ncbi:hypothetical protein L6R29_09555 [Myxococcota bacterium]|nr:hypothetical protein [Myxococcota bacterium]